MSFWQSELGEVTGKPEHAFAKDMFKTVPDGTMALARIDSFVNDEHAGVRFLVVNWVLTDGDFVGSKVSQKLKVLDSDPKDRDPAKTRHRGLNMMKLLYQLFNIKPKHTNAPTDEDLSVFAGKIAGIKIRETEPNAEGKQYNWVAEVHEAKGFKCETGVKLEVTHVNGPYNKGGDLRDSAFDRQYDRQGGVPAVGMDDDIPF